MLPPLTKINYIRWKIFQHQHPPTPHIHTHFPLHLIFFFFLFFSTSWALASTAIVLWHASASPRVSLPEECTWQTHLGWTYKRIVAVLGGFRQVVRMTEKSESQGAFSRLYLQGLQPKIKQKQTDTASNRRPGAFNYWRLALIVSTYVYVAEEGKK